MAIRKHNCPANHFMHHAVEAAIPFLMTVCSYYNRCNWLSQNWTCAFIKLVSSDVPIIYAISLLMIYWNQQTLGWDQLWFQGGGKTVFLHVWQWSQHKRAISFLKASTSASTFWGSSEIVSNNQVFDRWLWAGRYHILIIVDMMQKLKNW